MILTLMSCGAILPGTGGQAEKRTSVSPGQPSKDPKQTDQEQRDIAEAKSQVAPLLSRGNYSGALQFVMEKISRGLPEKSLAGEYLTALNGTLSQAEKFKQKGSFQEAGILYHDVLLGFPRDAGLISQVALAPEQVMANIDACAENLMAQGLVAYRSGDLDRAISIWKGILGFHPQFDPARKATDTAEKQLNNLKSMEEKQGEQGKK